MPSYTSKAGAWR